MKLPIINRSQQEMIAVFLQERTLAGAARKLGVGVKAARTKRRNLYAQLGVKDQKELFSFALDRGMICVRIGTLLPFEPIRLKD